MAALDRRPQSRRQPEAPVRRDAEPVSLYRSVSFSGAVSVSESVSASVSVSEAVAVAAGAGARRVRRCLG
ncbi:hypothetical protein GCM10010512_35410 [Streptomyces thermoviolaceus subsp. thermoviolaceus]|nr:hypothetical protein GCM10010499_37460 [Streptomyces thermoviolaceus subsp. apingens]GHB00935.1 hypothetical protein GCM10010512_35410 [Streptomyces thermoviolaceus subsp. thermoviolaceus]